LVSLPPTARFSVSHASADGHRGSEGRRRWTGSSAASAGTGKSEIGRSNGTRAHPVKNCLLFIFELRGFAVDPDLSMLGGPVDSFVTRHDDFRGQ
jgi:hypothetical protein